MAVLSIFIKVLVVILVIGMGKENIVNRIGISFTFAKGMSGSMNAQSISSISWSVQSISGICISVSVISMGLSFGLTLNQKAMTMRIPSSRNMGVKPEPVDPRPEPDTIWVGPQNTRGVSLGSHHGDKTSNNSLKKKQYYLGFRVST